MAEKTEWIPVASGELPSPYEEVLLAREDWYNVKIGWRSAIHDGRWFLCVEVPNEPDATSFACLDKNNTPEYWMRISQPPKSPLAGRRLQTLTKEERARAFVKGTVLSYEDMENPYCEYIVVDIPVFGNSLTLRSAEYNHALATNAGFQHGWKVVSVPNE